MKKTLFILLLFFAQLSFAQIFGEIEYKVDMLFNPVDSIVRTEEGPSEESFKVVKKEIEKSKRYLPQLKYHLKFNENQSLFYLNDSLINDQIHSLLRFAIILSNSDETYYTVKEKQFVFAYKRSELNGELFLVKRPSFKWEFSDETKEIAGYICQKATAKDENNLLFKSTITAWYSPDLPYSYGIKDFSGLSGIVLGLEERSEEHTSELQSRGHLVCRLLLEKKKKENHTL